MFQIKTEKLDNLIGDKQTKEPDEDSSTSPKSSNLDCSDSDDTSVEQSTLQKQRKKKGHGRLPASAYEGATKVYYPHESLHVGQRCPFCSRGNLFEDTGPGFLRIVGQAPLSATHHIPQRLRCATCKTAFEASVPEHVAACKNEKYAPSAKTILALLKYGFGTPFYRLQRLQDCFRIPLPTSTQWDLLCQVIELIYPVYFALFHAAAQGDTIFNDDTGVRILFLPPPEVMDHDPKRTGVFTTGIVSYYEGHKIILYFSGRNHAGENIAELLVNREKDLSPPLQVCDAAARNIPKDIVTIVVNCLVHGRRKSVELLQSFPHDCAYVLKRLGKVFHYEKVCRTDKISGEERLLYHQQYSKPIMESLHEWMKNKLDSHEVEENSALGQAFRYLLNHWEALTQFYRIVDAPLDSNPVERALKIAILNRKNAYFYRSLNGALVGDIFMSLIATCQQCGVPAYDYLNIIQENADKLSKNPQLWLPFNYQEQLSSKQTAEKNNNVA